MTKGNKRKDRNSSGNGSELHNKSKQPKQRGSSGEVNTSVSDAINQANAVLFEDNPDPEIVNNINTSVFDGESSNKGTSTMADSIHEPSNKELMEFMKSIRVRLDSMEKKLSTIEILDQKVTSMEKEINRVWNALENRAKRSEERLTMLEDRSEASDMGAALMGSRVTELEKQRDELREDLTYMKSQSMRNNLIFTNVPEDNSTGNEPTEVTEKKLREHMHTVLKLTKEMADSTRFERVHRSPGQPIPGKTRNIIAKFTFFQDREHVRKEWKQLKGTNYYMYEQFPKEVQDKRRPLVKKMKEARDQGKQAWLVYDTLYVDGRPMKQ